MVGKTEDVGIPVELGPEVDEGSDVVTRIVVGEVDAALELDEFPGAEERGVEERGVDESVGTDELEELELELGDELEELELRGVPHAG